MTLEVAYEESEHKVARVSQKHRVALIRGYEKMIGRYEKLGMRDRAEDARIVLRKLRGD